MDNFSKRERERMYWKAVLLITIRFVGGRFSGPVNVIKGRGKYWRFFCYCRNLQLCDYDLSYAVSIVFCVNNLQTNILTTLSESYVKYVGHLLTKSYVEATYWLKTLIWVKFKQSHFRVLPLSFSKTFSVVLLLKDLFLCDHNIYYHRLCTCDFT